MNEMICAAIRSKNEMEIFYNGGTRIIEPHCHGISKAGNEVIRAYQVSGYSKSRNVPFWRLFDVSKISGMRIREQKFLQLI